MAKEKIKARNFIVAGVIVILLGAMFVPVVNGNIKGDIARNRYIPVNAPSNSLEIINVTCRFIKINGSQNITCQMTSKEAWELYSLLNEIVISMGAIHGHPLISPNSRQAYSLIEQLYGKLKEYGFIPQDMGKKEVIDLITGDYGKNMMGTYKQSNERLLDRYSWWNLFSAEGSESVPNPFAFVSGSGEVRINYLSDVLTIISLLATFLFIGLESASVFGVFINLGFIIFSTLFMILFPLMLIPASIMAIILAIFGIEIELPDQEDWEELSVKYKELVTNATKYILLLLPVAIVSFFAFWASILPAIFFSTISKISHLLPINPIILHANVVSNETTSSNLVIRGLGGLWEIENPFNVRIDGFLGLWFEIPLYNDLSQSSLWTCLGFAACVNRDDIDVTL